MHAGPEALALLHLSTSWGGAQHKLDLPWLQEHLRVPLVGNPCLWWEGCPAFRQWLQAMATPEAILFTSWCVDIGVRLQGERWQVKQVGLRARR